jgi:hypothetical protein
LIRFSVANVSVVIALAAITYIFVKLWFVSGIYNMLN